MRKKASPLLVAMLLTTTSSFAQFEGVLEMKMTVSDKEGASRGGGTMTAAVAKAGSRSDVNLQMGGMTMKMTMLQKADTPNVVYRLNDANKTYSEIDLAKAREMANQPQNDDQWTVQKLGQEKILDYQTQHILAKPKSGTGQPMEMWIAKDFLDYDTFSKLQWRRNGPTGDQGLAKALKEAGTEGMPLKSVVHDDTGGTMTMEVVKVEKKSLPASTFEIPAGYTKSNGGIMDMMGGMSGPQADAMRARMEEARKQMQEQMKNMTPEQREMIEKMMQQRGGPPR